MPTLVIVAGAVALVVVVWMASRNTRARRDTDGGDGGTGMFYGDGGTSGSSSDSASDCVDSGSDGGSCDGGSDGGGGD